VVRECRSYNLGTTGAQLYVPFIQQGDISFLDIVPSPRFARRTASFQFLQCY